MPPANERRQACCPQCGRSGLFVCEMYHHDDKSVETLFYCSKCCLTFNKVQAEEANWKWKLWKLWKLWRLG